MTMPFHVAAPIFLGGVPKMKDADKTTEQLIDELVEMREWIDELEAL